MGAVALNRTEEIEYPLGDRVSLLACYAGLEIEERLSGLNAGFRVLKRLISSISSAEHQLEVEGVSGLIPSDPGISLMMSRALEAIKDLGGPLYGEALVKESRLMIQRLERISDSPANGSIDKEEAKELMNFCFALSRKAEAFEDSLSQFGV